MRTISRLFSPSHSSALFLATLLSAGCKDPSSSAPSQEPSTIKPDHPIEAGATPATSAEGPDAATAQPQPPAAQVTLHKPLQSDVEQLLPDLSQIPEDRRKSLDKLALFIRTKRASGEEAKLTEEGRPCCRAPAWARSLSASSWHSWRAPPV